MGRLLLGASPAGLALVEFSDPRDPRDAASRIERLERRLGRDVFFPGPESAGSPPWLDRTREQLNQYFTGERRDFDLPLDVHGTTFEEAVWNALRGIPYGDTRSYDDIAVEVARPGGARAVGQANGRNPVAIVIPCHRVINQSGALGGYGGGATRKRFLLGLELRPGVAPGGSGQIQLFGTIPR